MEREKIPDNDTYYMGIALAVRERANCTGNRVGAVLVFQNRVVSTGYNGVPEGMTNCLDGGCLRCTNPGGRFPSGTGYDLCICVHGEQNAVLSAARFGIAVENATIYSTMEPCYGCLKELLQARVKRIVYLHPWQPSDADPQMDSEKKAEHDKILACFTSEQLAMQDKRKEWAVTKLRKAAAPSPAGDGLARDGTSGEVSSKTPTI
jgi:dCMP deaminase